MKHYCTSRQPPSPLHRVPAATSSSLPTSPPPPLSPLLPPQSLIFLGCVAAAGLGLNLLFLAIYLSCLCCARRDDEDPGDTKKKGSCCVTWSAVSAGLISW